VELRPHLDIDALVTLPELGGDTYQITQMLAPYGIGNPQPTFMSLGVELMEWRRMGINGEHLRMKLKQGDTVWDSVAFRMVSHMDELSSTINIVYNLETDKWGGREKLRLNILDFTASQ
jgi:single-stranded-DNA-specific exonuclease